MKKYILLFFVLCLFLTGCGTKKVESKKQLQIKMSLNSSAGEINNYELDKEDIIFIERIYDSGNCKEDADGCGGNEIYKITPLKEGKVKMKLVKTNVNGDVLQKDEYTIEVDKNLNIKSKHKKVK